MQHRLALGWLVTILTIAGCGSTTPTNKPYSWSEETQRKYEQLHDGMTYKQVVEIMGEEGRVCADDAYGVKQLRDGAKERHQEVDEVREWKTADPMYLRVALRDKKLVGRSLSMK